MFTSIHPILLLMALGWAALTTPARAQDQTANSSSDAVPEAGDDSDTGDSDSLAKPDRQIIMKFQQETSTEKTHTNTLYFQPQYTFHFDSGWNLGIALQAPVFSGTTTVQAPGSPSRRLGIENPETLIVFSKVFDARWAYGFGVRITPPASDDTAGNAVWQFKPGIGVRYSFLDYPGVYFEPKIRYPITAKDPSHRNISEPQLAPTLHIPLPDRWFVTFFPSYDVRINYGDPISGQTGRLFLPLDVSFGRKFANDVTISLELSAPIIRDYPVYNFKTEFRVTTAVLAVRTCWTNVQ